MAALPRPQVSFPPVWLSLEDRLFVAVWNSASGVTLLNNGRIMRETGTIDKISAQQTPSTDRGMSTASINVGAGWLLSFSVNVKDGTPRRGQTFVYVAVVRGGVGGGDVSACLIQDYVAVGHSAVWPGAIVRQSVEGPGVLRSITGSDPAAGAEVTGSVPTNARWRLLSFQVALTTSADAGDRRVHVFIDDGSKELIRWASPSLQTASLTYTYYAESGVGAEMSVRGNRIVLALPTDLMMFQAWRIRTFCEGMFAADDYAAPQYTVEEWNEE